MIYTVVEAVNRIVCCVIYMNIREREYRYRSLEKTVQCFRKVAVHLGYGIVIVHARLTLRRLMSYIYGASILDVSRSHTTTQHSR